MPHTRRFAANSVLAAAFLALPTSPTAADSASGPERTSGGWKTGFVENDRLPPVFRQGALERADGSKLTFYVGNFHDSISEKKPLLIFADGSGAQSHFVQVDDKIGYGLFGLIAKEAGRRYHVAAVEKRGVSFGVTPERPGSAVGASAEYVEHATLADRAADIRLLVQALAQEPVVDPRRIVVVGHSEGADVAAAAAANEPCITHVAFLAGGGAPQFFDFFVMRRKSMAAGGASAEEIEKAIGELESQIRDILEDPQSETKRFLGHAYKRWSTFATQPAAENLLKTKARLFVAHGTADSAVPIESFDYLVVELLRNGRQNVAIRRYAGCDHGFLRPGEEASADGLMRVVRDVLEWADADAGSPIG